MIPVLYASNETAFTSNGLGRLPDCISCKVIEERNGQFECEFEYPIAGAHYADIAIGCYIFCKPNDTSNPQAFRIYKATRPLNGRVTFYAEHISYRLNYIPVMPYTAASCLLALQGLATNAAETCPFTFTTDKSISTPYTTTTPASIRARLGGEDGSILEAYHGEYEFDMFNVYLWTNRGSNNNVTLRYGKNLKTLEQEQSIENTYTGVCPFWAGEVDGVETVVTLPEKVLHHANYANFPYALTLPLDMSSDFSEQPTEQDLRDAATNYMTANNIGVPTVNINVDFVALWQTENYKSIAPLERVELCDTVNVVFDQLGVNATAKVIKTEYNVLLERYNSIELGDAKTTLGDTIASISETEVTTAAADLTTRYNAAISAATSLITGGLGGHVVIGTNADGEPNEILIMDTDDVNTATNVIRLNSAGIGFSTNGYNGDYSTAWTIDGTFNAAFVNVINMNASALTAGVIQDTTGLNYWNLDTGDIVLTGINNAIDAVSNDLQNDITDRLKYIRLVNGTIYLGEEGNELELTLTNSRLSFWQSGVEVAYITDSRLYITDGEFINSMQVGQFAFIPAQNGSLSFMKVG